MRTSICKICNQNIKSNEKLAIKGYGTVHIDCYKDYLIEKYGEDYANSKIKDLLEKKHEKQLKNRRTQEQKEELNKSRLAFEKYIENVYDINLDKRICIKLANINNGTYKGLKEGISYDDLLYMFKSKYNFLVNMHMGLTKKGYNFTSNYNLFCYDLAVIVNKYDDYKAYKEKQKLLEVNREQRQDTINKLNIVNNTDTLITTTSKENDIKDSDLVEDVLNGLF